MDTPQPHGAAAHTWGASANEELVVAQPHVWDDTGVCPRRRRPTLTMIAQHFRLARKQVRVARRRSSLNDGRNLYLAPADRIFEIVKKLGHLFERLVHTHRRREARRQLTKKHIGSVLFLCHGNVYRSPYAAAAFKRALAAMHSAAPIKVASAGFIAPGRAAPQGALIAARLRGIDLSSHLSTLVTANAVSAAGLVAVMSEGQARGIRSRYGPGVTVLVLGDLDPLSIQGRTIPDPLGRDAQVLEEVYSRIERCVEQLAELVAR